MESKIDIKKRLVLELPYDKHRDVKVIAAQLGESIKTFIDISIKERIEKLKKNEKYYE